MKLLMCISGLWLLATAPSSGLAQQCNPYIFVKDEDMPEEPTYTNAQTSAFWVSPVASPGQQVVVTGAFPSDPGQVEVVTVPTGCTDWKSLFSGKGVKMVAAESMGPSGINFSIPPDFPQGVYAMRINDGLMYRINPPIVYWAMGLGQVLHEREASPGDTLRVVGLNFPKHGFVLLTDPGGSSRAFSYNSTDAYQISVVLPTSLGAGTYSLQVAPGENVDALTSLPATLTIRPRDEARFANVACPDLRGDGKTDNTDVMRRYVASHPGSAGNPVIFQMSEGVFLFKSSITLRPYQYVEGSGQGKTTWEGGGPEGSAPDYWIIGTHDFGLMDLSLVAPLRKAIVANFQDEYDYSQKTAEEGHVHFDHVTFITSNTLPPVSGIVPGVIQVGGPDIKVTNCTIDNTKTSAGGELVLDMNLIPANGGLITNNLIKVTKFGLGMFIYSYHGVVFENNTIGGVSAEEGANGGVSLVNAKILGSAGDFLASRNTISDVTEHDREGFTTDLGGGTYLGKAVPATDPSSTITTLMDDPDWGPDPVTPARYRISIIAGTGEGQSRYVEKGKGRSITLNQPWTVRPDENSILSISLYQEHLQVMDNRFENTGHLQFYGGIFDSQMAGNQMQNAMGISIYSGVYFCASQPIDNICIYNNSVQGTRYGDKSARNFGIILIARNTTGINGLLARDNQFSESCQINFNSVVRRMRGVLFEHNSGGNVTFPAAKGSQKTGQPPGIVLH